MSELLLINPRTLGSRRKKMALPKRNSKGQFTKRRTTRRAPAKVRPYAKSRRTKRAPSSRLVARRKRNLSHTMRGYYPNPRRRSYRRNPINSSVLSNVMPALSGAAGAVLLDIAWGYIPIPATLKSGPFQHLAKAAGAIGLGMAAKMVTSKRNADMLALGALTVVAHAAIKQAVTRFAPNIEMGGTFDYGYPSIAVPMDDYMGEYVEQDSMGAYLEPASAGQDEMSMSATETGDLIL